jgi:GTPase SAR1 family protein
MASRFVSTEDVANELKRLYQTYQRPLEENYLYGEFHSPILTDADIDAKPMVLLLGQYSVGKTTFIKHLLGRDFPGMRIGPEPTTDRFTIVMYGEEDRTIPGNALAVDREYPFTSLQRFGTSFLGRLEAAQCSAPILERVTLVDTPGVLSGEKQRAGRLYDFPLVVEWFAARADMILLLFDAHKLDISDEFKATIEALRGNDDKIRVVLNKADGVTGQQLMRVYGALMWSLGKVVSTPEVPRVYIGSFAPFGYANREFEVMFRREQSDLLRDLTALPSNAATRKVNEMVKRARLARVHALIISHLKKKMPSLWGHKATQEKLVENMADEFFEVMKTHRLPKGDFPDLRRFKEIAATFDFSKFKRLDDRLLASLDEVVTTHIPAILSELGRIQAAQVRMDRSSKSNVVLAIKDGIISEQKLMDSAPSYSPDMGDASASASAEARRAPVEEARREAPPAAHHVPESTTGAAGNPFASPGSDAASWSRMVRKSERDEQFFKLPGASEAYKVAGGALRELMLSFGLEPGALSSIWVLADHDKDGFLDDEEFALLCHLLSLAKAGEKLPSTLPPHMVPPKQRR